MKRNAWKKSAVDLPEIERMWSALKKVASAKLSDLLGRQLVITGLAFRAGYFISLTVAWPVSASGCRSRLSRFGIRLITKMQA